jgi:hypothetical protein
MSGPLWPREVCDLLMASMVANHQTARAVLSIDEQNVSADMIALAYDWKAASAQAERNGRPEWAYGLRTGWFIPGHSA